MNLKKKLEDISAKLESIARAYNYKENDDYARACLKQINLELDALNKEIQGFSE